MFLGALKKTGEDNIFFIVHELFTAAFGRFYQPKIVSFSLKRTNPFIKKAPHFRGACSTAGALHVVVEEKLVWMRTQTQCVMFLALVRDPHLNEVFGEHVAFEQE